MNSLEELAKIKGTISSWDIHYKKLDFESIENTLKVLEIIKQYIELDTFINTPIIRFKRDLHIVAIPNKDFEAIKKELDK